MGQVHQPRKGRSTEDSRVAGSPQNATKGTFRLIVTAADLHAGFRRPMQRLETLCNALHVAYRSRIEGPAAMGRVPLAAGQAVVGHHLRLSPGPYAASSDLSASGPGAAIRHHQMTAGLPSFIRGLTPLGLGALLAKTDA